MRFMSPLDASLRCGVPDEWPLDGLFSLCFVLSLGVLVPMPPADLFISVIPYLMYEFDGYFIYKAG